MKNIFIFVMLINIIHHANTSIHNLKYTSGTGAAFPCGNVDQPPVLAGFFVMESQIYTWKGIPGFEDYYEINHLGIIRSNDRIITTKAGQVYLKKGRILKMFIGHDGYQYADLYIEKIRHRQGVHQIMCDVFFGHHGDGINLLPDHINNIKTDNKISNLQLISKRENNIKSLTKENRLCGTCFQKGKWRAAIEINGDTKYLGRFITEKEAHEAYNSARKLYNV